MADTSPVDDAKKAKPRKKGKDADPPSRAAKGKKPRARAKGRGKGRSRKKDNGAKKVSDPVVVEVERVGSRMVAREIVPQPEEAPPTAAEPEVSGAGEVDVSWESPSAGTISFGWAAPLVVAGTEQPIDEFPRHESPWGSVNRLDTRHRFAVGEAVLDLDFDRMIRTLE